MKLGNMRKWFLFLPLLFPSSSSPGNAAEINVISVGTVSSVLHDLIPEYEKQSGNKLKVAFGNPAVTIERLAKGDPADVVIVAGALWDQAEKQGRVKAETKTELPASSYSIGMKAGTQPSSAATPDDFKRLVAQVQSVALVDRSPSIPLLQQSANRLGIGQQFETKAKIYPTGGAIAEALARGEVDLGITTRSELVAVREVVVLGPMPTELLPIRATSTAAITRDASAPIEAAAFLKFLTSPDHLAVFRAKGFD